MEQENKDAPAEVKEISVEKIDDTTISVNTSTTISVEHDIESLKAKRARLVSDRDENYAQYNKEISEVDEIINKASQVGVV